MADQPGTVHIFVSGFRAAYRTAVLNAVCAPIGGRQKFTYTESRNVSQATIQRISNLPRGSSAFITFVDRFGKDAYRYIPIRFANFIGAVVDAKKFEISVRLGEWPEADQSAYSQWLANTLVPLGAPRLNQTPENENDGEYVIVGDGPPKTHLKPEDGWRSAVDKLSTTKVLATSSEQTVVFARLDVLEESTNKTVRWEPDKFLCLNRAESYRARVSYVFPLQETNHSAEVPYNLTLTAGLESTNSSMGRVGAQARADEFGFRVLPFSQRAHESMQLQFGPLTGNLKGLVAPRLELVIEPRTSHRILLQLLAVGLVWVLGSGVASQASVGDGSFRFGFYAGPLAQYLAIVMMLKIFGAKLT